MLGTSSSLSVFVKEKEKSKNILNNLEKYNQEEENGDENQRKASFKYNDSDSEDETPVKKVPRITRGIPLLI